MSDYEPIDCNVHDRLEDLAVRGPACAIRYRTANGEREESAGVVTDVYAKEGAEYLDLDSGVTIRLDRIECTTEL